MTLARTEPGHLDLTGEAGQPDADLAVKDTGKPVALDQQLMLADDTNRAFSLDNAIVRAFHRMMMTAVRSG